MTYKEIYDNLAAEIEIIKIKKNYLWSREISKFKKERIFPAWKWLLCTQHSETNKR